MMIKKKQPATAKKPSLWVRNIQLASFSILVGLPAALMSEDYYQEDPLRGFEFFVWGNMINNALGGLLVALVISYANNVAKSFSNAISTVLATLLSVPLFGFE